MVEKLILNWFLAILGKDPLLDRAWSIVVENEERDWRCLSLEGGVGQPNGRAGMGPVWRLEAATHGEAASPYPAQSGTKARPDVTLITVALDCRRRSGRRAAVSRMGPSRLLGIAPARQTSAFVM